MKAKVFKDLISGVPDDAEIIIENNADNEDDYERKYLDTVVVRDTIELAGTVEVVLIFI